jgi:hypothetical protein
MKKLNITFIDSTNFELDPPVPAKKSLPDWYKNHPTYTTGLGREVRPSGDGIGTIKKCLAVFDSMTAGYIIKTPLDVNVVKTENGIEFQQAAADLNYLTFHRAKQAQNYPNAHNSDIPKFVSPWGIKTPKGYSCLFIPPCHHNNVVNILPAIIDTDQLHLPVEFPFLLSNPNFTGIIPKGTPIAQVIPFKRDSWEHKISNSKEDHKLLDKLGFQHASIFFDKYKKLWWSPKSYD